MVTSLGLGFCLLMTFDHGANGTVEPSLAHAGRDALLVQLIGNDSGADSLLPEVQDFLDDPILFGVDDQFSIEPVVTIGKDRRTHIRGPLRLLLRSACCPSKCVAA